MVAAQSSTNIYPQLSPEHYCSGIPPPPTEASSKTILNEVLSITAQELDTILLAPLRVICSSMKS